MKAALKRCPSRSGPRFWKNIVPLLINGKNTIVIAGSTSNRYSKTSFLLIVIARTDSLLFVRATINFINPTAPRATIIAKAKTTGVCSRNEKRRITTRSENPIRMCCSEDERFGSSHRSGTDLPITRQIDKKIIPHRAILKNSMSGTRLPKTFG
jgi:hypothetical protein